MSIQCNDEAVHRVIHSMLLQHLMQAIFPAHILHSFPPSIFMYYFTPPVFFLFLYLTPVKLFGNKTFYDCTTFYLVIFFAGISVL